MSQPVLLLAGPTAAGKTDVALELAAKWGAEIVSADARQIYRGLDVGTAKPGPSVRKAIPHHLLDILDPDHRYSAARFLAEATAAVTAIMARGRRAIVVGGTGLYLKVLREGIFEAPETTPEVREQVDQLLHRGGKQALLEYLAAFDPPTAAAIDRANPVRLRRAVEFHLMTRESMFDAHKSASPRAAPFDFYPVVLVRPRAQLHERIADRTRAMLKAGWLDEVRRLSLTWDFGLPAFDAVGYRELYEVLQDRLPLEQAVERTIVRTRQYAKRQVTWFSHQGHWLWMSPETEVTLKISSGLDAFAENKSA